MPYLTVGTEKNEDVKISYADYGEGDPVVLIHGWPLSHRMWEPQIAALTNAGYRVIAYDRRGFGESYKPWEGHEYEMLTDDLYKLINELSLENVTLVGFSMGGGEVARYIGKYGTNNLKAAVLMSAVPPFLLKTDDNPDGVEPSVFEEMIEGVTTDRPAFLKEFTKKFMNWDDDSDTNLISKEQLEHMYDIGVWANPKATAECIKAFSSTDFRGDLEKFGDIPTLVMHGDSDQTVPFEVSGKRAHEMIQNSQLQLIKNGPHGITASHASEVSDGLINFIRSL